MDSSYKIKRKQHQRNLNVLSKKNIPVSLGYLIQVVIYVITFFRFSNKRFILKRNAYSVRAELGRTGVMSLP